MLFYVNPSIGHSFLIDELNRCFYGLWMDPLVLLVTQYNVLKKINCIRWMEKKRKRVIMGESWLERQAYQSLTLSQIATACIETAAATVTFFKNNVLQINVSQALFFVH